MKPKRETLDVLDDCMADLIERVKSLRLAADALVGELIVLTGKAEVTASRVRELRPRRKKKRGMT